jgi:hypothetical protein
LCTYERPVESSMGSETNNKNSLSPQNNVSWQKFDIWKITVYSISVTNICLTMQWTGRLPFIGESFSPNKIFFARNKYPTFFCNTQKDNFSSTFNNIPFCIFRIKIWFPITFCDKFCYKIKRNLSPPTRPCKIKKSYPYICI